MTHIEKFTQNSGKFLGARVFICPYFGTNKMIVSLYKVG